MRTYSTINSFVKYTKKQQIIAYYTYYLYFCNTDEHIINF